ncbi:phosphatidylglycerophosphatase A [Pseudemcibacter aquimaris]|uniref:phosphatidylglycerophosphatase A family protein n=1 Tax=Pseudemcibacter aquimaris TaxID=2857064 RepID=UPI002010E21A|nr:phosphatidylglycerophosphatase A [Pseudemcibacter aquimaris]MCC3860926.1 phosphatidylglycerophosphatase A [Pseudemcibacter aquimaris]WDU59745.1 phosphatidylglycerophosphatase A [Pseudemcibacter aquimaris]
MSEETKKISSFDPAFIISTWFYSGSIPIAPGTMGSIAALPFAWLIIENAGLFGLANATLIVFVLGLWSSRVYMEKTGKTDPGEVVIDEVVGQWLVCMMIADNNHMGQYVLALLAFRVFDIMKPWPVSFFDKRHDSFGVMMDDVVAGILGAMTLYAVNIYVL